MKLGTQTVSIVNHLMSSNAPNMPAVGTGCTILFYSDRYPGTVFAILKGDVVCIREDKAKMISGSQMSEEQEYEYEQDPNGREYKFKLKDGQWREMYFDEYGSKKWRLCEKGRGNGIHFGTRERYYDPTR